MKKSNFWKVEVQLSAPLSKWANLIIFYCHFWWTWRTANFRKNAMDIEDYRNSFEIFLLALFRPWEIVKNPTFEQHFQNGQLWSFFTVISNQFRKLEIGVKILWILKMIWIFLKYFCLHYFGLEKWLKIQLWSSTFKTGQLWSFFTAISHEFRKLEMVVEMARILKIIWIFL